MTSIKGNKSKVDTCENDSIIDIVRKFFFEQEQHFSVNTVVYTEVQHQREK